MKTGQAIKATLLGSLLALGVATVGCERKADPEDTTARTPGEQLDDATITAKVKAALLADQNVSGMAVDVSTHMKNVQLSGFVDTEEQKRLAEKIAKAVEGVKSVKNNISLKQR
jgi:hyperosmotically inducible periplasmic protein